MNDLEIVIECPTANAAQEVRDAAASLGMSVDDLLFKKLLPDGVYHETILSEK